MCVHGYPQKTVHIINNNKILVKLLLVLQLNDGVDILIQYTYVIHTHTHTHTYI